VYSLVQVICVDFFFITHVLQRWVSLSRTTARYLLVIGTAVVCVASQVGGFHVATDVIRYMSLTCHVVKLTATYLLLHNSLVVPCAPLWCFPGPLWSLAAEINESNIAGNEQVQVM